MRLLLRSCPLSLIEWGFTRVCLDTFLGKSTLNIQYLLPRYFKHDKLNVYFDYSMYSVAVVISSPIIGYSLKKARPRTFVQCGLLAMSIAMFGFAIAAQFKSKVGFLTTVFITRFIQGFASS